MSNEPKEFRNMTADEQLKWITDFSKFDEAKLPTLCALGDVWEASHIKCFEEGLQLLRAFSMCREFVKKSLMFRDYSRRIDRMTFYINLIKDKIEKGEYVKVGRETLVNVSGMQPSSTRRRGRSTKAEIAAKALAEGVIPERKNDLFNLSSSVGEMMNGTQEDPELPQLKNIAWLLSADLQTETKQVSFYRAKAAASAEQAKLLADKGEDAAIIEPHSREAAEYTEKYKKVYEAVNEELAMLFLYLQNDENYADLKAKIEAKGSNLEALKAILLLYFNKMDEEWKEKATAKKAKVLEKEEKEKEESENQGMSKAERADLLHRHRTYILRKDVELTPSRIRKVKEKIAELESIGENVDEYKVILAKMEEELREEED